MIALIQSLSPVSCRHVFCFYASSIRTKRLATASINAWFPSWVLWAVAVVVAPTVGIVCDPCGCRQWFRLGFSISNRGRELEFNPLRLVLRLTGYMPCDVVPKCFAELKSEGRSGFPHWRVILKRRTHIPFAALYSSIPSWIRCHFLETRWWGSQKNCSKRKIDRSSRRRVIGCELRLDSVGGERRRLTLFNRRRYIFRVATCECKSWSFGLLCMMCRLILIVVCAWIILFKIIVYYYKWSIAAEVRIHSVDRMI